MPLPLIITMIWLQLAGAHAARQLRNIQRVENLAQLEGCAKPSGSHGSDFAPSRAFFDAPIFFGNATVDVSTEAHIWHSLFVSR